MYEEHFGLAKKPFQLSPDAKFFFPSAEHAKALSFLQYGLGQGDGFIVITGNIGTGKTMLAQALVNDLDESEFSVATIVTSNLQDSDLLQMLVNHLGIEVARRNKAALLKGLEHYFVQELLAHRRTLLIIDEAQNLPQASLEELRMLSNFQQDGRPLVQIFLLGQQEFRQTLLSDGLNNYAKESLQPIILIRSEKKKPEPTLGIECKLPAGRESRSLPAVRTAKYTDSVKAYPVASTIFVIDCCYSLISKN